MAMADVFFPMLPPIFPARPEAPLPKRSTTRLTKRVVDALAEDKDRIVFDSDLPGFGVHVRPDRRKAFIFQYKAPDSRTRRMAIGATDDLTVDQARVRAEDLRAQVKLGGDPQQDKRDKKAAATVRELAKRWIDEHAKKNKKPRSIEEDERNINLHILPTLGNRKVRDLSQEDIQKLHARLSEMRVEKTIKGDDGEPKVIEIERKSPVRANRVLALLSTMMKQAEAWKLIPHETSPCRGFKKHKEVPRKEYLKQHQVEALWKALDAAEAAGESLSAVSLFRLLLLTGRRLSEVLTIRWADIDFQRGVMNLPDSKTGAATYPLNSPALALLARLPQVDENPYVLPGEKEKQHFNGVQRFWRRIRKRAGIENIHIHDLRHSFASVLADRGESLLMIGKTLGHRQAATTARYAHLKDDPVRAAIEGAGAGIMGMAEGKSATVLDMRKQRKRTRG